MPYTLKPNKLFVKDPEGGGFLAQNVIAEQTTEEMVAEIQTEGTAIKNNIINQLNQAISDSQTAIDTLETQKDNIVEAVASMAELGTDTSLSTAGMAADAKATGNAVNELERALDYNRSGSVTRLTWLQGNRGSTTPTIVTENTTRCTLSEAPYLYEGDEVSITGLVSGQRYLIYVSEGGVKKYDSGWLTSGMIFVMPYDGYFVLDLGKTSGAAITPSEVSAVVTVKDASSRIYQLQHENTERTVYDLSDTDDFMSVKSYTGWKTGFSYSQSAGYFIEVAERTCSDFISIKPLSDFVGGRVFNLQFFTAAKAFISEDTSLRNSGVHYTSAPSNAAYMIVTYLNQYSDEFSFDFRTLVKDTANVDLLIKHNLKNPSSIIENSGQLVPYVSIGGTNATITDDDKKTRYLKHSKRVSLTKASSASELHIKLQYGITMTDNVGFWFYADQTVIDKFTNINVYFHSGQRGSNAVWKAFYPVNGWNFFNVALDECTVVGTAPELFNYVDVLIYLTGDVGDFVGNVWFDAFFEGYKLKPSLAIGYDGMWTDSYTNGVYDWHMSNNIPCNIGFTDFDSSDSTSFDNNYEVLHPLAVKMANLYGFEMGAYGGYGNRAGDVRRATDVETCRSLIYGNVNALNNEIDQPITFYVLSQGLQTTVIEKAALLSGIKVMRNTRNRPNYGFAKDADTINCYPLYSFASVAEAKSAIDNLISHGYCGMMFTHAVVTSNPTQYQSLYTDWLEVMTYIKNKVDSGELSVMNVSEMMEKAREEF